MVAYIQSGKVVVAAVAVVEAAAKCAGIAVVVDVAFAAAWKAIDIASAG
jgi:hypothetical protein